MYLPISVKAIGKSKMALLETEFFLAGSSNEWVKTLRGLREQEKMDLSSFYKEPISTQTANLCNNLMHS